MHLHQDASGDTKSFLVSGLKNVGLAKGVDRYSEFGEVLVRWCERGEEVPDLRDLRKSFDVVW